MHSVQKNIFKGIYYTNLHKTISPFVIPGTLFEQTWISLS